MAQAPVRAVAGAQECAGATEHVEGLHCNYEVRPEWACSSEVQYRVTGRCQLCPWRGLWGQAARRGHPRHACDHAHPPPEGRSRCSPRRCRGDQAVEVLVAADLADEQDERMNHLNRLLAGCPVLLVATSVNPTPRSCPGALVARAPLVAAWVGTGSPCLVR